MWRAEALFCWIALIPKQKCVRIRSKHLKKARKNNCRKKLIEIARKKCAEFLQKKSFPIIWPQLMNKWHLTNTSTSHRNPIGGMRRSHKLIRVEWHFGRSFVLEDFLHSPILLIFYWQIFSVFIRNSAQKILLNQKTVSVILKWERKIKRVLGKERKRKSSLTSSKTW